jgi:archaeosine synthase beta-subunit
LSNIRPRANPEHVKIITQEIGKLRLLSDSERVEHQNIINWVDKHYFANGSIGHSLAMVLPTRACKYARAKHGGCSFCTLPSDNPLNPTDEQLKLLPNRTLEIFLKKKQEYPDLDAVKFYTSGSFLDPWELPLNVRSGILKIFDPIVSEIVIETRNEYVIRKHLDHVVESILPEKVIVAIGQESTDDEINSRANNKGHKLSQFRRAVKLLKSYNFKVKAYILLKPIFLSEAASIQDALLAAKRMFNLGVDGISINPCYIGKGTLMEKLFRKGTYSPPWLWSVAQVTEKIKNMVGDNVIVICDPVAAGKDRGPRNCGVCDGEFREILKQFSGTQKLSYLKKLNCSCKQIYDHLLITESLTSSHGRFYLRS